MPAVPLKREYRPTLGELLAPGWRRLPRAGRVLVLAALVACAAALAGAVATLAHPRLSRGGATSFSFSYPGLYRVHPRPGGLAWVRSPSGGRLRDSFAVAPLTLTSYRGRPSAALALYADLYVRHLADRYRDFRLRGEGWTQVDSISPYAVYNVFYTARVEGQAMYGRDVLLLPERAGARRGVAIAMLTRADENRQVTSPLLVGAKGLLAGPLDSFALG
jgi:hypothetical protein